MEIFDVFKKKICKICSPVEGICEDISAVNDGIFSERVLGDGFAIDPSSNQIYSPCDGVITMIFPTGHAFGIETKDGKKVLVHIGLDTVNMQGKGFTIRKKLNDRVTTSDLIVEIDREVIKSDGYNPVVMVILTEPKIEVKKEKLNKAIKHGETVISFGGNV